MPTTSHTIRYFRPSDRKPVTQLALSIEGIGNDHERAAMVRKMIKEHTEYLRQDPTGDTDVHEIEAVNQKTGERATATVTAGLRVAAAQGRAIGFSYLAPPADWAHRRTSLRTSVRIQFNARLNELNLLAVHPGHQGRGIGTALLEEVEHRCRDKGYRIMMVMVNDKTGDAPATNWYRRRGYTFGLPGVPWRVLPYTERQIEVEYDELNRDQVIGFKALHASVQVEPASIRTASALGVRNAALPTIAGLLDD